MSNFVFVIDTNKKPCDPVPPGQARRLLKQGNAAVFRRYPFVIILKYPASLHPGPHQLKIDPGSKTTGLAIIQQDKVVWGAQLQHRGQKISNDLKARNAVRRSRRNRKTRYRRPPIKNRGKRQRSKGWLAPSLKSRVYNIMTWVLRIKKYVPITGVSQELVKFNTQVLVNPETTGIEYQQGELFGYEVREYLLQKWGRKCAYCSATNTRLEIDHIHPRSRGGSNRVSNLTIACHECNQAKSNQDIRDFLAQKPDVLNRVLSQAKQPLKDAASVNSTRWALFNQLQQTDLPVEIGTGGRTKYNRTRLELPKTHWLDAACVGTQDMLTVLTSQPLLISAKGWGTRQMCITNKHGFPIKHRERKKVFFGFQTGDMAQANLPRGKFAGTHVGRLTVRKTGVFEMTKHIGKVSPVRHKYCKAIHRNDGYMYAFSTISH
ncbi:RNA-guided endonuclease IscB [Brasilonema bromeliae]|uniref:HNH endonuclease n=1 Tax=Brasilonema bromeliae SPC951 TaxID=385972 RepID=A0ABX1P6X9_9CYAN|nr:RNA-guided endonuclease IscB [Brasilonema bromeliae]NMG19370.1 HNH endonuclease [Brasilonema bromeliae SPC951]